ncbi:PEPxxWA-CTERM sorting domain-containing protein [Phenylobacterium sp.]|uniref:PEPxxWA-CTERM sorting domain-containing protein n=1 Tax=Phenylobacterium sp. TaxID=1871053 RepID=UPI001211B88E|nr:PEPxxWA-CTERM sorting domain-containing protein [Phenylobacterium sp.]THD58958.1 MAG: PEP-CTERM sorting domain-containing protein [Phenylobacterium sp.]
MRKIINGLLAAAAVTLLTSAPAMAQVTETLVEGSGWNTFDFGDTVNFPAFQDLFGDTITFDFTVAATTTLRITDGYNDGDQFSVTLNNLTAATTETLDTSTPIFDGNNIFDNWSAVFDEPGLGVEYSHLTLTLDPGVYSLTGDAIQSPFGAGQAAIELGTLPAVPEPSVWALMLVGFGGLGAMLRRRKALAAMPA